MRVEYLLYRQRKTPLLGTERQGQHRKLVPWSLRLAELYFEVIHWAGDRYQAADVLFCLLTTGGEKAQPVNGVPGLKITEAQLEREDSEKKAKIRYFLSWNGDVDAIKAGLPAGLQVSDESYEGKLLTKIEIVTEQDR